MGKRPEDAAKKKKAVNRGAVVFLIVMLALPILQWLVFWLYININSIFLAFQYPRGGWTLFNFRVLFDNLRTEGRSQSKSLRPFGGRDDFA